MIKNRYYKFAKSETKSIEEVDCLIEEYKNIPKIRFGNGGMIILTSINIFFVMMTTLYINESNIKNSLYTTMVNILYKGEITNTAQLNKEVDELKPLLYDPKVTDEAFSSLNFCLYLLIVFLIVCSLINVYRQQRLAGLYEYKRELIREKNECTDKSTDLTFLK